MSDATEQITTGYEAFTLRQRLAHIGQVARKYAVRLTLVLCILVIAGLAEGVGISAMLPMLSALTQSHQSEPSIVENAVRAALNVFGLAPTLGVLLSVTVGGFVLKAALVMGSMAVVAFSIARTATDLRLQYMRALLKAGWPHFTASPVGTIVNAMAREADGAASLLNSLSMMAAAALNAGALLIVGALISWQVTAAAVVIGAIVLLLIKWTVTVIRRASWQATNAYATLAAKLSDALNGIRMIKAMGREHVIVPVLRTEISVIFSAMWRSAVASHATRVLPEPILVLALGGGLFFAITYWDQPLETLLVMALLFYRGAGQVTTVQQSYAKVVGSESTFLRMMERIARAEEAAEDYSGTRTSALTEDIRLEDVTFAYGENQVLKRVSLTIPASNMTTLFGPSGAGKSTMVDLVLRFYRPQQGRVLVDGVPIDELDVSIWRKQIGYVPQDLFLLHETVLANITLGDPELTEGDAERALRQAGAWEFVSQLSNGLHTVVGERGSTISGGQRQRIAIARALVRQPRLLVLDEPTTALDPRTERELCATLASLRRDMTILAVSHQRAIADISDVVYKVSNGRAELAPESPRVSQAVSGA
uniref:ABC transporter protein (ABCC-BAC) n=1 Tax=uncultured marine thaumarchaeote KM3_02_B09 TaxID=1455956 RepID=A0A075G2H3_9ARCH|nr:ABC transporter protein (ABCC-BAC) [uncultured marine thaumarchaeote KM3_02_B09]